MVETWSNLPTKRIDKKRCHIHPIYIDSIRLKKGETLSTENVRFGDWRRHLSIFLIVQTAVAAHHRHHHQSIVCLNQWILHFKTQLSLSHYKYGHDFIQDFPGFSICFQQKSKLAKHNFRENNIKQKYNLYEHLNHHL